MPKPTAPAPLPTAHIEIADELISVVEAEQVCTRATVVAFLTDNTDWTEAYATRLIARLRPRY